MAIDMGFVRYFQALPVRFCKRWIVACPSLHLRIGEHRIYRKKENEFAGFFRAIGKGTLFGETLGQSIGQLLPDFS